MGNKTTKFELCQKINGYIMQSKYSFKTLENAKRKQKELNNRLNLCGYYDRNYIIAKVTTEIL